MYKTEREIIEIIKDCNSKKKYYNFAHKTHDKYYNYGIVIVQPKEYNLDDILCI